MIRHISATLRVTLCIILHSFPNVNVHTMCARVCVCVCDKGTESAANLSRGTQGPSTRVGGRHTAVDLRKGFMQG